MLASCLSGATLGMAIMLSKTTSRIRSRADVKGTTSLGAQQIAAVEGWDRSGVHDGMFAVHPRRCMFPYRLDPDQVGRVAADDGGGVKRWIYPMPLHSFHTYSPSNRKIGRRATTTYYFGQDEASDARVEARKAAAADDPCKCTSKYDTLSSSGMYSVREGARIADDARPGWLATEQSLDVSDPTGGVR